MTAGYVEEPIERFIEYGNSATRFLEVSMRSIHAMQDVLGIVTKLGMLQKKLKPDWDDTEFNRYAAGFKAHAEFAAKESAGGFPLLQEFTIVGFWGAFESAIEDVVIGIISNEPVFLRAAPFAKVKIPLAEFESLERDDRMRILLRELQRTLRTEQRHGVNGFEAMLDTVNFSGSVPAEVREALWEMHHVRNLIVHRASRVDRAFAEACPKMGLKVGDSAKVSREQCAHYVASLLEYGALISERIQARYNSPLPIS
jgi:hypothetical protein